MLSAHNPPGHNGRRVLVVDDNAPSALTLSCAMGLRGYDARACFDGRTAAEIAHRFRPDVVLLDLAMPGVDGFEVCRRLRQDTSLAGLTVIAQTGWGSAEACRRTAEAGFDYHMTKPVDLNRLREFIVASTS